jgi:hypothetical protein
MVGHERPGPAAVYEPALRVLAGVPGGLYHPIQRYVLDDRQLPHRITSSRFPIRNEHQRGATWSARQNDRQMTGSFRST